MATNEAHFTQNWGGQDPHSPTTGARQRMAGEGTHASLSAQRWAARRSQVQPYALPVVQSPLNAEEIQAFAQGAAPPQRDVWKDAVIGGILGYAVVRAAQRRRGRR
jgi:hypothetical protein